MSENVTRYPIGWRIMVLSSLILGTALGFGVFVTLAETWKGYSCGDPEFLGVLLAFRLVLFGVLGTSMVVWIFYGVVYHWFTLNRYVLDGHTLHVYSPVTSRHRSIALDSIASVHSVPPLLRPARGNGSAAYVRVLEAENGTSIRVSTDLPIWPAIAASLQAAGFDASARDAQ